MSRVGRQILSELLPDRWADLALETLCKKWRAVMDRFIHEIWEDQKLDVLSEIVNEDATFYFGEDILTGVGAIREFIGAVHTAFPDLRYESAPAHTIHSSLRSHGGGQSRVKGGNNSERQGSFAGRDGQVHP